MASEKAIETLRQFIETHATVNASEFYAGVKVPTQREALAAIDAAAAVDGDAQWNAVEYVQAVEAEKKVLYEALERALSHFIVIGGDQAKRASKEIEDILNG